MNELIKTESKLLRPRVANILSLMVVLTGVVMVMGCRQDIINNPRIATREASEEILPTALPTPLFSFAPTPTLGSSISDGGNTPEGLDNNHILSIWVNETSPEHQMLLNRMADSFSDRTGIQAEVQLVSPDLLPNLVQTAVISDTLPDLILHPTEFSIGWAEAGILDVELATIWLDELGRDSFYEDGLQKLKIDPSGQQVAALPSDGWKQLLIYRSDWLQELGLSQPNTYESIVAAAEGIHDPEQSRSGIVVPTESDLISTQQVFEHFALANGCDLVEESGRISILHPACLEALEYYRFLVNEYSPIGFQTDVSALNAYLTGRTGMIVTSPASIPIIAGFIEANYPTCDDCLTPDYLLNNSGFVTEITGSGEFASSEEFAGITALGVTKAADPEITKSFVNFWFGEGYLDWISVNPERKIPMRRGTSSQPDQYSESWAEMQLTPESENIKELLDGKLVEMLSADVASADRWAFEQNQGSLMTVLYEDLILAPLLQEMLSGYFTSSQTIVEMYTSIVNSIVGYEFPFEVVPTPTP